MKKILFILISLVLFGCAKAQYPTYRDTFKVVTLDGVDTMSFDLKSSNIKIFGTKPIEITNLANLDSLADLTGVTQKSVLFRNGTGLYDSDFNYDPSSNQLKIGSGYGFQESGSVIYFNSPGGFGGQASNSGRLNYNISSGSGNPTLGVYSSTHSGIGYTKVGPTVYGDIISMDTITARFTDTSFVVKKPLIIEDSLQWPDGTWQSTASSGGSSPWTIDADGIHYSNNIGVGINSSSVTSIKTNGQTYGIYSVGTTYGMYGEGANTGVYGSGGTGVKGLGVNYGVYSYSVDGIGLKSQTLNNLKIASFESGSPTTEKAYIDSSGSYITQGTIQADSIKFGDGTWQSTASSGGGSSYWTSDTYGITYANNIGVGTASQSDKAINVSTSSTYGVYSIGSSYGISAHGNTYGAFVYGNIYGVYAYSPSGISLVAQTHSYPKIASFRVGATEKAYIDSSGSYVTQGDVQANSYSDANGIISPDYVASVTFSNAEVLANSTKTIISAPGSGKAIVIMRVMIHKNLTTAYTYGSSVYLRIAQSWGYGNGAPYGSSGNNIYESQYVPDLTNFTESNDFNNSAIQAEISGITGGGNSANTITVYVYYKILDTN